MGVSGFHAAILGPEIVLKLGAKGSVVSQFLRIFFLTPILGASERDDFFSAIFNDYFVLSSHLGEICLGLCHLSGGEASVAQLSTLINSPLLKCGIFVSGRELGVFERFSDTIDLFINQVLLAMVSLPSRIVNFE